MQITNKITNIKIIAKATINKIKIIIVFVLFLELLSLQRALFKNDKII